MPAAKKSPLKPSPVKPPFAAAKAIANARATAAAKAAAAKSAAAAKVAEMAKALAPAPSTTTTVVKTKTVPTTSTKSTKLVSDPPAKPSPSTPLKSEGTATLKEGRANALPNPMPQWKDGKAPSEQPTQKEAVANYKIPKNVKGKGWDRSRQPDIGKNKRDLLDSDSDSDESNLHSQSLPEKPSVKK
jgi:large subunit ribosomal protein L22e